jgi:DNA replication protein DnaC
VWLWGRTGTGKSLLAALKLKQKVKQAVRKAKNPGEVSANDFFFLSVKEFFDRLLPASVRDEDDAPRFDFDWLTQDGYLVLDDIDKRKPTNERQDMLYALFNTIVERDVPMAITSNKSPAKYCGSFFSEPEYREAVLDRIGSHFKIIETVGESFRKGVRK